MIVDYDPPLGITDDRRGILSLVRDPHEMRNAYHDPCVADQVSRSKQELDELKPSVGDSDESHPEVLTVREHRLPNGSRARSHDESRSGTIPSTPDVGGVTRSLGRADTTPSEQETGHLMMRIDSITPTFVVAVCLFAATGVLSLTATNAPAQSAGDAGEVVFSDTFDEDSRGKLEPNLVKEPPPLGMGYSTDVPEGFRMKRWTVADAEPDGPRRSFWAIPKRTDGTIETYMIQSGRSRNSICYANIEIPRDAAHYVIEFQQRANDNDYIGFVLGATRPVVNHDGVEIGYERQIPGTDETVPDLYYRSPWGQGRVREQAKRRQWVQHRLEVNGHHVAWSQDGRTLLAGTVANLRRGGYFGIRQKYERGTAYDDVRITVLETAPESPPVHGQISVSKERPTGGAQPESTVGTIRVLPDTTYKPDATTAYERQRCKLDWYLPENAKDFATIVWFHGGGLRNGDKSGDNEVALARRFASDGVAVAAVNYRLSPQVTYPAYIDDAAAAVALVRTRVAEHGGDADRVFVAGHSAGGYMTAMVGMDPEYLKPYGLTRSSIAGFIPVSGQMITHSTVRDERGIPRSQPIIDAAAPAFHATADTAPLLCIVGSDDLPARAEENRYFVAAMRAAGHKNIRYFEVEGRDHSTIANRLSRPDDVVAAEILRFLDQPDQ